MNAKLVIIVTKMTLRTIIFFLSLIAIHCLHVPEDIGFSENNGAFYTEDAVFINGKILFVVIW